MARQVDYEALVAKLEVTDVYVAIHDEEPVLLAVCMDCDSTILRAIGAEVNAAELHGAILDHDCSKPADTVVVDDVAALAEALGAIAIESAEPPAPKRVETVPVAPRVLSISDRCDRCSAQAFVRIEVEAGEVLLCGHDYAAVALTVTAAGYPVIDERAHINQRPSLSATAE